MWVRCELSGCTAQRTDDVYRQTESHTFNPSVENLRDYQQGIVFTDIQLCSHFQKLTWNAGQLWSFKITAAAGQRLYPLYTNNSYCASVSFMCVFTFPETVPRQLLTHPQGDPWAAASLVWRPPSFPLPPTSLVLYVGREVYTVGGTTKTTKQDCNTKGREQRLQKQWSWGRKVSLANCDRWKGCWPKPSVPLLLKLILKSM